MRTASTQLNQSNSGEVIVRDKTMSNQNLTLDKEEIIERESDLLDTPKVENVELNLMKHDRVGDTVYSSNWIIGTLIALSKANNGGWSEELESDLCMLWDMCADKDVVTYLVENDFLKLAENTLSQSVENRLTEIVLGIIANMACQSTVLNTIGKYKELTCTILNLLSSDDTESLMQIIRLLQAVMSEVYNNQQSIWLENLRSYPFIGEALIFILKSSTNKELLMATTELLYAITYYEPTNQDNFMLEQLSSSVDLLPAMIELLNEIIPFHQSNYSEDDIKFMESWLSILHRVTRYLKVNTEHKASLNKLSNIVSTLLAPYKERCNLILMDETTAFCIQELLEFTHWLKSNGIPVMPDVNSTVVAMTHKLKQILQDNMETGDKCDSNDVISKLSKYLNHWMKMS